MPALAAISDDLSTDFAQAAELARAWGLDGLAIRHVGGVNVTRIEPDDLRSIRRIADGAGLRIAAISSPIGRDLQLPANPERRASAEAMMTGACRAAELLDTELVRVFAGWRSGRDAVGTWRDRPDDAAGIQAAHELVARLAAIAAQAGVRVMVELEGASYAGTMDEIATMVAAVGSPHLVVCWDVCNGWWAGEDPGDTALDRALTLPVVDVQFKDVRSVAGDPSSADLEQVVLGEGDIPYGAIVDRLLAHGYDGWFTAERVFHPRRPEDEPALRSAIRADVEALVALAGRTGARA